MNKGITYRNLGEIFVIEIENKNIEVGTIEGLSKKYYPEPFNKYVVIKNIYKYPEKVKEYALDCQFTNHMNIVGGAPVIRTYAPMSNVIQEVVNPALCDSFNREVFARRGGTDCAIFSYYDPEVIKYHQYHEPHIDVESWRPLYPSLPQDFSLAETRGKELAGVIFLDETFGTEILVNKDMSYYYSERSGLWGTPPWAGTNNNYYPEGNDSHYEHKITIGGEYNSAVFYYSDLVHRPYYLGASDKDFKDGRLIQNIWFDDMTQE